MLSVWVLGLRQVRAFNLELVGSEGVVPERVELPAHPVQARLIDAIDAASADSVIKDQAGVLENPQVLRHRGTGDGQRVRKLPHRARSNREAGEDRPPRPVTQGSPSVINRVSSH